MKQDLWLWALFVLALIVSVGWAAEWWRNEIALEALLDTKSRTLEAILKNSDAVLANSARIDRILAEHRALVEAQQQGPRNTACDAKALLEELRAQGIKIKRQAVEDRCP